MSTDFETTKLIDAADLFDGQLAKHGVREHIPTDPKVLVGMNAAVTPRRCLTDGRSSFLWVWCGNNVGPNRLSFTRYASNMANGSVMDIIYAIETEFNTIIFTYDSGSIPDAIMDQIEPTRDDGSLT